MLLYDRSGSKPQVMQQMGANRCPSMPDHSRGEGNNFSLAGTMNQWNEGLCDQQALYPTEVQERHHQEHGHQALRQVNQTDGMQQRQGSLQLLDEGNNFPTAGITLQRSVNATAEHCQSPTLRLPSLPHFIVTQLAFLPGTRCYTDASILPDS